MFSLLSPFTNQNSFTCVCKYYFTINTPLKPFTTNHPPITYIYKSSILICTYVHDITLSIWLCTVCPSMYIHGMNSSIQIYVILPFPYVHMWYVLICMYVVCPLMYEYKLPSMVWVIIRLSTKFQGDGDILEIE